eukprot:Pgem_evm1s1998
MSALVEHIHFIKLLCPDIDAEVIKWDLGFTKDPEQTVNRILDGTIDNSSYNNSLEADFDAIINSHAINNDNKINSDDNNISNRDQNNNNNNINIYNNNHCNTNISDKHHHRNKTLTNKVTQEVEDSVYISFSDTTDDDSSGTDTNVLASIFAPDSIEKSSTNR